MGQPHGVASGWAEGGEELGGAGGRVRRDGRRRGDVITRTGQPGEDVQGLAEVVADAGLDGVSLGLDAVRALVDRPGVLADAVERVEQFAGGGEVLDRRGTAVQVPPGRGGER